MTAAFVHLFDAESAPLRKRYDSNIAKGHHYFPFNNWPDSLSEDAKRIFGSWKSGQLSEHGWDKAHDEYGRAVRELFDANYPNAAALDVNDAIHFIEMVNQSSDPRIMSYLQTNIHPKLISPISGEVKIAKFGAFGFALGIYPLLFDDSYTIGDYLGDAICSPMGGCEGPQ